jgi:chromate transporter
MSDAATSLDRVPPGRDGDAPASHGIPFAEAVRVWVRIAALSFGGPAGQIAVMHRILVDEKRWIGETRFLHALNYCMLLPGPEAQQLAVYIGWLMHKTRGGLVAGTLFVLPGLIAIMALSWVYALYGKLGPVEALFFGLKAAVLAIVLQAVLRIGRRALTGPTMAAVAAAAFAALFFFDVPFPLVVAGAGIIGFAGGRAGLPAFRRASGHGVATGGLSDADSALGAGIPAHAKPGIGWSLRIGAMFLALWLVPVIGLSLAAPEGVFADIAVFFSKMAVVTFGGAYAVLSYVAQQAVEVYGWLAPREMLDGLGMAETTPGPLIMVNQFVGFLGAYRDPGGLDPLVAGTLGGFLTTWVTFVPCFLWIFLGAPFVETLRSNRAVAAALATITAAVVGVILNLAVWFALHVVFAAVGEIRGWGMRLYAPDLASLDAPALILTAGAILAMFRFGLGMMPTLAGCAAAGMLFYLATGTPG